MTSLYRTSRTLLTAAILALCAGAADVAQSAPAVAEAPKPLEAAEKRRVTLELADMLEQRFVFPDRGAAYAAMLRANLASGAYDGISDPEAFGARITADLQAVAPDSHLRLGTASQFAGRKPAAPPADLPQSARAGATPGLEEAKMIGDVAYLRFNGFFGDPAQVEASRAFLLAHAGEARAVIIDVRPHRGGGFDEMNAILPLLYAQKTTLLRMDTRAGAEAPLAPSPFLERRDSPPQFERWEHVMLPDAKEKRLQHVPVFCLTSRRTASAAEHLALALKRTHRATLIGETTRGAGHYGALEALDDGFAVFLPVGRTYDPDTGKDWEGEGVAPDVRTPADEALATALKLAEAAGAHPR